MSEKKRKISSSQSMTKVALEAIRGANTVNEIAQEFGGASNPSWVMEERIARSG